MYMYNIHVCDVKYIVHVYFISLFPQTNSNDEERSTVERRVRFNSPAPVAPLITHTHTHTHTHHREAHLQCLLASEVVQLLCLVPLFLRELTTHQG